MVKLTGAFVVVAALMGAIFCGFFANAETVTTTTTDFSYLTDVSGAFVGDTEDIETDYNPASNLTGYSVFPPGTDGVDRIPGISYREANPNSYWIQTSTGAAKTLTIDLTAVKDRASIGAGYANVVYDGQTVKDSDRPIISGEWGLLNAEIKTLAKVGLTTHYAPYGINLGAYVTALKSVYKDKTGSDLGDGLLYLSFPGGDAAGYPGFAANPSWEQSSDRGLLVSLTYSAVSASAVVDPSTFTVTLDGSTYNLEQVVVIWGGTIQSSSTSPGTTATMQVIAGTESRTSYIDPRAGVTPESATVTTTEIVREVTKSSAISGMFAYPRTGGEYFAYDKVYFEGNFVFGVQIVMASNGYYGIGIFTTDFGDPSGPTSGTTAKQYTGSIGYGEFANVFWSWSGSSSVSISSGSSKGLPTDYPSSYSDTISVGYSESTVSSVSTAHRYEGARKDYTLMTEIKDVTHNQISRVLDTSTSLDTAVTSTTVVESTKTYTATYWSNGYSNVSLSALLRAPSASLSSVWKLTDDKGTEYEFPISAVTAGARTTWTVDGADAGQYPAVILIWDIHDGKITLSVQRVTLFSDMLTYTPIGNPVVLTTHGFTGTSISGIVFDTSTPEFTHEIIGTTVLIPNGGLYINNGVFTPSEKFPEVGILKFKVISVAHKGDSMTIRPSEEEE